MSVGLIAALPAEIRSLTHTLPGLDVPFPITPLLTGIVCGTGPDRAAAAAETLIQSGVEGLVSWGTAAALVRVLHTGDLLLPENILNARGGSYATDKAWMARVRQTLGHTSITINSGPFTETRTILTGAPQKHELHERTGAVAADMESAVIMQQAATVKLPCIVIRSVVDDAHTNIPDALLRHIDCYGRTRFNRLMPELFRSPRLIGSIYRLGIAMHRATASLKIVAERTNTSLMFHS